MDMEPSLTARLMALSMSILSNNDLAGFNYLTISKRIPNQTNGHNRPKHFCFIGVTIVKF